MKDSPCHFCNERVPRCHSTCKEYKEFHQAREEELNTYRKKRNVESNYSDYMSNKILNMKKGNYRRGKKK